VAWAKGNESLFKRNDRMGRRGLVKEEKRGVELVQSEKRANLPSTKDTQDKGKCDNNAFRRTRQAKRFRQGRKTTKGGDEKKNF